MLSGRCPLDEAQAWEVTTVSGQTLYVVSPEENHETGCFERRWELTDLVLPALSDAFGPPLPVLLVGPPGSGKSTLARLAAAELGLPFYRFQAHDSVSAEDFICVGRISAAGTVEYVLKPLAAAALRGGLCLLDDVDKAGERALSGLVSVLDEASHRVYSNLAAVSIPLHSRFRLILAANHLEALPPFVRTRCVVFRIDHPGVRETLSIAKSRVPGVKELERAFLEAWKKKQAADPDQAFRHGKRCWCFVWGRRCGPLAKAPPLPYSPPWTA